MTTVRLFDLSLRFDRSDLTIVGGTNLQAELGDAVTSIPVERSMEQANTLTLAVLDEDQTLLRHSELFGRKRLRAGVLLEVDGFRFRLSELHKRRFGFDAVFYDEPSADLKRKHGALKTSRDAMTRPEVVRWMCVHAGVRTYIPELNTTPLIADLSPEDAAALAAGQRAQKDDQIARPARAKGVLKGAKLTVKGKAARSDQLRAMERVQAALDAEGEPTHTRARLATTLAPIGEASYEISAAEQIYGTHKGLYQSDQIPAADVEKQVHHFLTGGVSFLAGGARGYAKANPGASVGEVVSKVEISDGDAQFYDNYAEEARAIIAAWAPGDDEGDGGGLRTGSVDRAYVERYEFEIEADEDYLEAGARLAEEVRWRFFSDGQQIVYATDLKLAEAAAAVTLVEGKDGCDELSWTWTAKGVIDEVQGVAHLVRWQAPPGSVVVVDGEGAADGRYLLRSISRDLLDPAQRADLILGRPQTPLPEPASSVTTVEGTTDDIDDDEAIKVDGQLMAKDVRGLTPGQIIDRIVLPLAKKNGLTRTVAENNAGNAAHGATAGGSRSDHQGPPSVAWAADLGIGPDIRGGGNPKGAALGDKVARALARYFQIQWGGSGIAENPNLFGFRFQIIWRFISDQAGNHYTHVHFGVRKV